MYRDNDIANKDAYLKFYYQIVDAANIDIKVDFG